MNQKQDGGFNQCISVYIVISSPGNKKHLKQLIYAAPVYNSTKSVNSKVAYLKRSKFRIVQLLFFFSSQPSTLTREVTQLKQPSIVKIIPKDGKFVLV